MLLPLMKDGWHKENSSHADSAPAVVEIILSMEVKVSIRIVGGTGSDSERSAQLSLPQCLALLSYAVQLISLNASTAPHVVESTPMALLEDTTETIGVPIK